MTQASPAVRSDLRDQARGGGALEHMEPQGSFWMNAKPAIQPGLARCDKAVAR